MNCIRKEKVQKELLAVQEELVFYEPFHQLITSYESWFLGISNELKSTSAEMIGENFILDFFSTIALQVTALKRVIDTQGTEADTSFLDNYIDQIARMIANGDKADIINIMYFYSEIFAGAKRYQTLKKQEAGLLDSHFLPKGE